MTGLDNNNTAMIKADKNIGILNTRIASTNKGDAIIMDAANGLFRESFPGYNTIEFPTHEKLSRTSYRLQGKVDFNIACGTNLLHSHMSLIKQWNIGIIDSFFLKPVVLLGVGWRSQAKRKTDLYTRWLLRKILSRDYQHSVRDSYTLEHLREIGIDNVLNTGCPTIWGLDEEHCARIPEKKGEDAVLVLTDYSRNTEYDRFLVDTVLKDYRKVYFWSQGFDDCRYLDELGYTDRVSKISPSLQAYDQLLADKSISLDYVGTRLHGGIRALQHRRRSIIIGVDHRANIKKADFNLPIINRYDSYDELGKRITGAFRTDIKLPVEQIHAWKSQFV